MTVSQRTKRFLEAEFNNERHGGITPATVHSTIDSLLQWPVGDDPFPTQAAIHEVAYDLLSLVYRHGLNAQLRLLSREMERVGTPDELHESVPMTATDPAPNLGRLRP